MESVELAQYDTVTAFCANCEEINQIRKQHYQLNIYQLLGKTLRRLLII